MLTMWQYPVFEEQINYDSKYDNYDSKLTMDSKFFCLLSCNVLIEVLRFTVRERHFAVTDRLHITPDQ